MPSSFHGPLSHRLKIFFRDRFQKIREINQKFATPRIKTSKGVTIILLVLRIYLFVLLIILFFKFFTFLH